MPSVLQQERSVQRRPASAETRHSYEPLIFKLTIIVLAGLFVYAPAFHGDWLWDDDQEITANPLLRSFGGLVEIWTGGVGADYFPLKTTFQWILFQFAGPTPTVYHLANVILHIGNALLVWRLFDRLRIRYAWLGGLLFCVHPVIVESVAWISELKNTLSLPFLLGSMLAFIRFDESRRPADYLCAALLYLAAILCKTSVVMLPFTLLLYCWWKRGGLRWRDLWGSAPFFAISLAMGLITIWFQHGRAIGSETILVGGMASRAATAGMAIFFYLWKCVFPFDLLPIYPRWQVDPPTLIQFLPWPLLAVILSWLWTQRKTWGRHALLGLGFFLLNVFPILGFITMSYMRITWVADHFIYLPAIGVIGLMTAAAGSCLDRTTGNARIACIAGGTIVMAILTVSSHRYAGIFANEEQLWSYTLLRNRDAWQAHSRYGKAMLDAGRNQAGYFHIKESARLRPDLAETRNNFAAVLQAKGELTRALEEVAEACRLAPKMMIYAMNHAKILMELKKYEEARKVYSEILEQAPNNPSLLSNYGVTEYCLGHVDEAIAKFEEALRIAPDHKEAKINLEAAKKSKQEEVKPSAMEISSPEPE
ncbi:MAG: tetratricopeptide repeat protein [Cupriavidus sp.]|nr:MAG: tetratricopeptide repeat protein [Cupriavidus sp.]